MPDTNLPSPSRIERAMSEAMQLKALLEGEDEALLLGTIEGETDVFSLIDRLAERVLGDVLLLDRLALRRKRLEKRAETVRDLIQRMLAALELERLERDLATFSMMDSVRAVTITDEDALPMRFFRQAPDKIAIGKALKDGQAVGGAELAPARKTLRIDSR